MIDKRYGCCLTGYRPDKYPFKFKPMDSGFINFEKKLVRCINTLYRQGATRFFCGCAMGFDILSGEIVINLKREHPEIELICMVPFKGQEKSYPQEWKRRYYNLLNNSDVVAVLSDAYYKGCYRRRNFSMVDRADMVLTFYDGKNGGTAETLRYARKKGVKIINLADWDSAGEDSIQLTLI